MEDKSDMIIIKQSQEEIEAYRGGILISALGGIVSVIVDVDILFWYCIAMGLYFFRWSVIINYILILGKDGVIVEKRKIKSIIVGMNLPLNVSIVIQDMADLEKRLFSRNINIYKVRVFCQRCINLLIPIC